MANTKKDDLLIISRGSITYKTEVSDLMSSSGNITIDKDKGGIDVTLPITDSTNFPGWLPRNQDIGPLYVNSGSGTVHDSWIYIGGAKKDAKISVDIDTGESSGNYLKIVTYNGDQTGYLKDDTVTGTINGVGRAASFDVKIVNGFINSIVVTDSGDGVDLPGTVDVDFDATDGTSSVLECVVSDAGTGYTDGNQTITSTGSGLVVDLTTDSNGGITNIDVVSAGSGFKYGDTFEIPGGTGGTGLVTAVDPNDYDYTSTETLTFDYELFPFKTIVTLTDPGSEFVDGAGQIFETDGGTGSGMKVKCDVTGGELQELTLSVQVIGANDYAHGDELSVVCTGSGQYGLPVAGGEVITWLGEANDTSAPEKDEGWVIFSSISAGDDDGFVKIIGDRMTGTLIMEDSAVPAIVASKDITSDSNIEAKEYIIGELGLVGGSLTINGNSDLRGNVNIGADDASGSTNIYHTLTAHRPSGYIETDANGENVKVDLSGTDTFFPIGDNDFITRRFFETHSSGGPSGNNIEYEIQVPAQGTDTVSSFVLLETDLLGGPSTVEKSRVKFIPGQNITLLNDDGESAIEISAESTKVIFSEYAPEFQEGQLWYNTRDGRTYVGYRDEGNDTYGASDQWVDASPTAINGGDYVYRYGDVVENYLTVEGEFSAKHYDLSVLDNIADR